MRKKVLNMIKNTVNDVFNLGALKNDIKKAIDELIISGENYQVLVTTLVSGSSGQYIPHEVAKLWGEDELCSDPESEGYWEEWDTLQSNINDLIISATVEHKLLKDNPFNQGFLLMHTWESDGSFVLSFEIPMGTWDRYFRCEECGDLFDRRHDKAYTLKGKLYCEEDYKPLAREYFEDRWTNGGGFMSSLCKLCTISDLENLALLRKAFPEIVDGYCIYGMGKLLK